MGGRIHVDSEIGKGTEVRLVVPLKASLSSVGIISKEETKINFKGKVLVVEDNKTNQKVIGLMLQNLKVPFDIVSDGEEALEKIDTNIHQLVLMDINMPVMDGNECVKVMRKRGVDCRIVALTGNSMEQEIESSKEKGFDQYLTKPIELKVLKKLFIN